MITIIFLVNLATSLLSADSAKEFYLDECLTRFSTLIQQFTVGCEGNFIAFYKIMSDRKSNQKTSLRTSHLRLINYFWRSGGYFN